MNVAVTGASGDIGRRAIHALDDHELTLLTYSKHEDLDSVTLDVTEDRETFVDAIDGADVLVHLAWIPVEGDDWDEARLENVQGTYNAFEAAVENDLDRVVFPSSNHAVQMYNVETPDEPESMAEETRTIDHDDVFRPSSFYGALKVGCEALGSYYADRHGLEVVNLRIGWLMDEVTLGEQQDEPEPDARFARAMWLSHRDCEDAIRKSVEADLPENPLTANVVSRNAERTLSITHAMRSLGYRPRDDATEALE